MIKLFLNIKFLFEINYFILSILMQKILLKIKNEYRYINLSIEKLFIPICLSKYLYQSFYQDDI